MSIGLMRSISVQHIVACAQARTEPDAGKASTGVFAAEVAPQRPQFYMLAAVRPPGGQLKGTNAPEVMR